MKKLNFSLMIVMVCLGFALTRPTRALHAQTAPEPTADVTAVQSAPFVSLDEMNATLEAALAAGFVDDFWQQITDAGQMPLIFDTTAVFFYRGAASTVEWRGDFSAWEPDPAFVGQQQGSTDLWRMQHDFPADARLDYKIVIDDTNWILDPLNPYQQWGGFGPNSEMRMPAYG